jgi:hypothetical protein
MQIGVHGVFAQYYRDQIVENTRMGQRQAAEQGRWLNRAPTGYDMINGKLVPNEMAPLVRRIFSLRAAGASYPTVSADVGIEYSTARHISLNRVYLGEVRLGDNWFKGIHEALVDEVTFMAAQRANPTGQRRSKDLLSGKVRCGLCGRIAGVHYNDRNQAIFRCRHRGQGCDQPGDPRTVCIARRFSVYECSPATGSSNRRSDINCVSIEPPSPLGARLRVRSWRHSS